MWHPVIELVKYKPESERGCRVLVCDSCGLKFDWATGNNIRGNIYQCEECGRYICASCMWESELYKKEFKDDLSISNLEKIECLKCKRRESN